MEVTELEDVFAKMIIQTKGLMTYTHPHPCSHKSIGKM